MQPRTSLFLLTAIALAALMGTGVHAQTHVSELNQQLAMLAQQDEFAGSVLIRRNGEELLAAGYGLADRDKGMKFTAETVSTIGSITKQFTGAAILKLQEDGKLRVQDTLGSFFDDVPEDKRSITLHQLLTHTAGFVDGLGNDETFISRAEYLKRAWKSKLQFAPGERHEYSNTGYSILAAIVELRSEKEYESFLRDTFFEPLGMEHTGYSLPEWNTDRVAVGYRNGKRWGTVIERQETSGSGFSWHLIGNGGIHSTVRDMARWVESLLANELLNEESTEALFGEHVDEGGGSSFYGYGWVTFHLRSGGKMIGHNGGNGFFFADLNFFRDRDDLLYVMLVNDAPKSERVTGVIRRSLLSEE